MRKRVARLADFILLAALFLSLATAGKASDPLDES